MHPRVRTQGGMRAKQAQQARATALLDGSLQLGLSIPGRQRQARAQLPGLLEQAAFPDVVPQLTMMLGKKGRNKSTHLRLHPLHAGRQLSLVLLVSIRLLPHLPQLCSRQHFRHQLLSDCVASCAHSALHASSDMHRAAGGSSGSGTWHTSEFGCKRLLRPAQRLQPDVHGAHPDPAINTRLCLCIWSSQARKHGHQSVTHCASHSPGAWRRARAPPMIARCP